MNSLPAISRLLLMCLIVINTAAFHAHTAEAPAAAEAAAIQAVREQGGTVRTLPGGEHEVEFHLRGRDLTDDGLRHLAAIRQITALNLRDTKITGEGLIHLKPLKQLKVLHLERTRVNDSGIRHLEGLKHLVYLNLYGTRVTDRSLASLTRLTKLRRLYVWQTAVTNAGAARLRASLPRLKISRGVDLSRFPSPPPSETRPEPAATLEWMRLDVDETPPASKVGSNIQVVFKNRMKTSINLIWISYAGEKKPYAVLGPGESRNQNTYSDATWLITDLNNQPLGHFRTGTQDAVAVIPARR